MCVIPWLDRYSQEDALFDGLVASDPMQRVTRDPLTRFPVLMAIFAKDGNVDRFDAIAVEFQEWCTHKRALVYAPLAMAMLGMRPTQRGFARYREPPASGT